jgi:hypothetical protein
LKVAKPKRLVSTRRALPDARLAEINEVAIGGGDDPALDGLIVRLHIETACRRGALGLRPMDLDVEQCLIMLREKGGTFRWQPVSPTLMSHAVERGAPSDGQLLRYRRSRGPITYRRYDHLWVRIGLALPWVAVQQISTHWLRHTTLTWVERNFGAAVTRAYAGHSESGGGDVGTIAVYTKASMTELARERGPFDGSMMPGAPDKFTQDVDRRWRWAQHPAVDTFGLRLSDLDVARDWSGYGRRAKLCAGSPSPTTWPLGCWNAPPPETPYYPTTSCCANATVGASPHGPGQVAPARQMSFLGGGAEPVPGDHGKQLDRGRVSGHGGRKVAIIARPLGPGRRRKGTDDRNGDRIGCEPKVGQHPAPLVGVPRCVQKAARSRVDRQGQIAGIAADLVPDPVRDGHVGDDHRPGRAGSFSSAASHGA